jgi:hypothetical protein
MERKRYEGVSVPSGLGLPKDQEPHDLGDRRSVQRADTSVVKPHLSGGRMGAGADIEIDDHMPGKPIFRALGRG